jgi:hypothetical protein
MTYFRRGDRVQAYMQRRRTGIAVDTAGTLRQLVVWDGATSPCLESVGLLVKPEAACSTCSGLRRHESGCLVAVAADDGRHAYTDPVISYSDGRMPKCRVCDQPIVDRLHQPADEAEARQFAADLNWTAEMDAIRRDIR